MKPGLWRSLEMLPRPAAVLAEWRLLTGDDFDGTRSFLRPTDRTSDTFPCTRRPACSVRHEVEAMEDGVRFRAVSRDEAVNCPSIELQPHDLLLHELDALRLCTAIRLALGFQPAAPGGLNDAARSHVVGVRGAARSPVVLTMATSEDRLLREIEGLLGVVVAPFLLLTPTATHCTVRVEGVLRRNSCVVIPLSAALAPGERGRLVVTAPIDDALAEFDRAMVARGAGLVKTVDRIDQNLEAVAKGHYEVCRENEELRQLHADGCLKFATRVPGEDFQAFAVIMALGNRKAAAEFLELPLRTFYDRVDKWQTMGRDHQRMFRLVEWRKAQGRKLKVRLEDSLAFGNSGEAPENPHTVHDVLTELKAGEIDGRDYPELLRELFGLLAKQNAQNWQSVRKEAVEILSDELPQ